MSPRVLFYFLRQQPTLRFFLRIASISLSIRCKSSLLAFFAWFSRITVAISATVGASNSAPKGRSSWNV